MVEEEIEIGKSVDVYAYAKGCTALHIFFKPHFSIHQVTKNMVEPVKECSNNTFFLSPVATL